MKQCSKCRVSQELNQYKKDSRNRDGLQSQCTSCHRQYQQKRRELRRSGELPLSNITEKRCNKCEATKEVSLFYKDSGCSDGYSTLCKVCRNESMEKWRENNRDKYNKNMRDYRANNPEWAKDTDLRRCYGIGLKEYKEMFDAQGGVCAKCSRAQEGVRPLCVDHDPKSTKDSGIRVRALLCYKCNRDQHVVDNEDVLSRSVKYGEKHKSK